MATIYLSSTYEDLKDFRSAVVQALRQSEYRVIAMEDYVATDQRPVDKCLRDVEKADIYVGLFAFRYGYIPPSEHNNPNGLSITELELRHAQHHKIPCLTFVADQKASGFPAAMMDAFSGDGEAGNHIKWLRDELNREWTVSFFSSPYQLASLVQSAVARHLANTHTPEPGAIPTVSAQSTITWDIAKHDSPYPGLTSFTRDYAPVFFGRDLERDEILDRMSLPEGRFILVSGDSGVGKSSVVAAGILPRIEQLGLPGEARCDIVHMLPGKTQQPWNSFMMAGVGTLVTRAGLKLDAVLDDLYRDPTMLAEHLHTIIKKGTRSLLLFLDQMEELFTAQDLDQANRFLTALYHAVQDQALWVLATIRSDHLHYCHRHDDMVKVLRGRGHYPLGRVDRFMMRQMIVKPAQCAGLQISEELATRLMQDTEEDTANLPLLAFTLNQLFAQRTDHELSERVYKNIGGVGGAIGAHVRHVEAKIHKELGYQTSEVLPSLFQTLAKVHKEEGIPTRNRPLLAGFDPKLKRVIDLLVTERLLRTEGEGESATVSIIHEKLFEAWPSLMEYVAKSKKELVDRTLLESRASKWAQLGKPWFDGLATGQEYKDFRRAGTTPTALMKEYLAASVRARYIQAGVIAVILVLVGGTGFWLWKEGLTVEDAMLTAQSKLMSIHINPAMVRIPGGTFEQGDTHGRGGKTEQPVHKVTIKPFALGKYEVTFDEYKRFVLAKKQRMPHDEDWGRGQRPVINVSWGDAKDYAAWLSKQTGNRYRLPTEAEWEYAGRSIAKKEDHIWAGTSDENQLADYAVYSLRQSEPVGTKTPNSLGLYDMSGNVWEWVEDCWHKDYNGAPMDGSVWLESNGGNYQMRVIRGGSWMNGPADLRTSFRGYEVAGHRASYFGFRLAQDLEP